jgi:two-component system, NtrC family, sensor kinase
LNANGLLQRAGMLFRSRFLLPAAGLLLSSLILAMLWSAHASSVAREHEVTLRMEEDVRGAAATLSYFFYERMNDMRNAADNRQLLTYFENKALGMSEEYGLLASRLAIEEHLGKLVQDRSVGGEPIYSALALTDTQGTVIAESRAARYAGEGSPWKDFTAQGAPEQPLFTVDYGAKQAGVVLRQPLALGGQPVGYILARIPLARVLQLLVRSPESGVDLYCVTEGTRLAAPLYGTFDPALLSRLTEPGPDRTVSSQRVRAMSDGDKTEQFAIWASVAQTPLRVLTLVDAREFLGTASPWLITGVSALLCALTLAALGLAWRANSGQLVLTARLEEKTQAECAIRQKASELEQLLDSLPGNAFFKDDKGRYITGNASLCALVGLTREELAGKTDHELFPAELADKYVADDARILSGELVHLETEDQVPSGAGLKDVLTRKVAVHNADGGVTGLIGLGYDITEQKRVERELQTANAGMERRVEQRTEQLAQANALLQAEIAERQQAHREASLVLSAVSALLIGVDTQGRVSKWNQAASEIFGLAEEDSLGREFASLPLLWETDRVLDGLAQCGLERQTVKLNNLWYERSDGKEGFLYVGLSPIIDEKDVLEGVLVLGTDITDFRVLEAQLAQAQKLEAIGQLAAGVAHEINTPTQYVGDTMSFLRDANADLLAVMDQVAELAAAPEAGCGPEALQELSDKLEDIEYPFLRKEMPLSFTRAKDGIERVSSIVRAMRSFSHPGQGEKRGVDINEALTNTITVSRNEWKYVATMETDLDPELPQVICLPAEMNQVFLNIVINAAHAVEESVHGTTRQGLIRVATAQEQGGVRISISDTGGGIPAAVQGKIFDPFFTTKEVGKGTGQGLTLAYDIVVNKHGGSITFDTEEGRGTTFHIHLPLGW